MGKGRERREEGGLLMVQWYDSYMPARHCLSMVCLDAHRILSGRAVM